MYVVQSCFVNACSRTSEILLQKFLACLISKFKFRCTKPQLTPVLFRLEPEAVELADDKRYFITQPGSSVATSLIEGEAKEKKVGILHIRDF